MSTKKLEDVMTEGREKYFISLTKLTGKKIKDIEVMISTEFGDPCIQLFRVVMEDETKAFVEGEHDIAYLDSLLGCTEEDLKSLREEMGK